jgi:quinol monooxygenase YgiN
MVTRIALVRRWCIKLSSNRERPAEEEDVRVLMMFRTLIDGDLLTMATLFVKHVVSDYDNWKRVYDDFASVRKEKGVTGASVHRDPEDPNTLVVTHQFKDVDAAAAFADSEELKSAMANAGVTGPPEIWICEDIEQTPY